MRFTKLDYCQYLLSSQINYTLTNLADHLEREHPNVARRQEKGEFIRDLNSRIKGGYADVALTATI